VRRGRRVKLVEERRRLREKKGKKRSGQRANEKRREKTRRTKNFGKGNVTHPERTVGTNTNIQAVSKSLLAKNGKGEKEVSEQGKKKKRT